MPTKSKKSSNRKSRALVTAILLCGLGVAGLATYVHFDKAAQRVPDVLRRAPEVTPKDSTDEVRKPRTGPEVEVEPSVAPSVKLLATDGDSMSLNSESITVPTGQKPIVFVANAVLKTLKIDQARAIGVDIKGKNALIDFNEGFDQGFGSSEEGTVIKAFQTVLGQFPQVDSFQFVVDGKVLDTLGQVDLSEPIAVIRPGITPTKPTGKASESDSTKPSGDQGTP